MGGQRNRSTSRPFGATTWATGSTIRFRNRKACIFEGGIPRNPRGEQVNGVGAHDVIVIGASAGGIAALKELMADLPADLPAAILVVLHVSATGPSALPSILDRVTDLEVRHATDGEQLEPGSVLIAPPGLQLTVAGESVRVERGPREKGGGRRHGRPGSRQCRLFEHAPARDRRRRARLRRAVGGARPAPAARCRGGETKTR